MYCTILFHLLFAWFIILLHDSLHSFFFFRTNILWFISALFTNLKLWPPSLCLSVNLFICLCLFVYLIIYPSVCQSVFLPVHLYIYVSLSMYPSIYLWKFFFLLVLIIHKRHKTSISSCPLSHTCIQTNKNNNYSQKVISLFTGVFLLDILFIITDQISCFLIHKLDSWVLISALHMHH